MNKFLLVILIVMVVGLILVACTKAQDPAISGKSNLSFDLNGYSEEFVGIFGEYIGADRTIADVRSVLSLAISENDKNVSKVFIELEAEDDIVIKQTIDKEMIQTIPDITLGCTSYDIAPYKDNVEDTIIKIVAKFE